MLTTNTERHEVAISQLVAGKRAQKVYTFDQVFGAYSTQVRVFAALAVTYTQF